MALEDFEGIQNPMHLRLIRNLEEPDSLRVAPQISYTFQHNRTLQLDAHASVPIRTIPALPCSSLAPELLVTSSLYRDCVDSACRGADEPLVRRGLGVSISRLCWGSPCLLR